MQNTPVTFKLDKAIRDKASKMKKIHKYKTYDLLFTDILDFFLEHNLSPKDASKPLHKLIADVRETFVTFQRTFESKKLMPLLFELKQQYLTTNLTMQDFINYSTEYNNHLLEVLENVPQNKIKSTPVYQDKLESISNEITQNSVNNNFEELKNIFNEFDKIKKAKLIDGENKFVYDIIAFNTYMDKIRLVLNKS